LKDRAQGAMAALAVILAASGAYAGTTSQNVATDTGAPDLFQPPPNLFQLTYGGRSAPGSNNSSTATNTFNIRYDHAVDLPSAWTLTTRFDLPLQAKYTTSPDGLSGQTGAGIGDSDAQAALIDSLNERWAFGFGMRLIAPTGNEGLSSGKWRVMPIVGARYALPEVSSSSYFEPLLRYDASVAGDPTKRNIRNLQFAPMLNIGLPSGWSLTLYPDADIRFNFGDPAPGQTGRWFVPIDVRVTKLLTKGVAISCEVGVPIINDYPVYNFKTQLRLAVFY